MCVLSILRLPSNPKPPKYEQVLLNEDCDAYTRFYSSPASWASRSATANASVIASISPIMKVSSE